MITALPIQLFFYLIITGLSYYLITRKFSNPALQVVVYITAAFIMGFLTIAYSTGNLLDLTVIAQVGETVTVTNQHVVLPLDDNVFNTLNTVLTLIPALSIMLTYRKGKK